MRSLRKSFERGISGLPRNPAEDKVSSKGTIYKKTTSAIARRSALRASLDETMSMKEWNPRGMLHERQLAARNHAAEGFIEKTRNYDDSRVISLQRNDLGVVVRLLERRYR